MRARASASSTKARPSYSSHLRDRYAGEDDDEDNQSDAEDTSHSALDDSQLDTSRDSAFSDRSSTSSLSPIPPADASYHALRRRLGGRSPPPNAAPTAASSTPLPHPPSTPTPLDASLWPALCDVFDQAERVQQSSTSVVSFLDLLSAHSTVTAAQSLSPLASTRLFSYLIHLHRLSAQFEPQRPVDWRRLLRSAFLQQCRHDPVLRADSGLLARIDSDSASPLDLLDDKAHRTQSLDALPTAARPSLVRQMWTALQQSEVSSPSRPSTASLPVHTRPPVEPRRPSTAEEVQALTAQFAAWREVVVAHRPSAEILARAQRCYTRAWWRRWADAWRRRKADRALERRSRARLSDALRSWHRSAEKHAVEKLKADAIRDMWQESIVRRSLRHWHLALVEQWEDQRMMRDAHHHYRRTALPRAVNAWMHATTARARQREQRQRADAWTSQRRLSTALRLWRTRLQEWKGAQTRATDRLLPLQLRGALRHWHRWTHAVRSAGMPSSVAVHALLTWVSTSFDHPLPYHTFDHAPSSPLSTPSASELKPSRLPAYAQHVTEWRRWATRRVWSAWRQRTAQWTNDRLLTATLQTAVAHRLLRAALLSWRAEHALTVDAHRCQRSFAVRRWLTATAERKARKEQATTARLVHAFHVEAQYFALWKRHHGAHLLQRLRAEAELERRAERAADEQRITDAMLSRAEAFCLRRQQSAAVVQWRRWTLQHLLTSCTSQLVQARWEERAKVESIAEWRSWTATRHQQSALRRKREEQADVMYVGRLMSVLLVCWRLQLRRRLTVRQMAERRAERQRVEVFTRWRLFVELQREERRREREEEAHRRKEADRRTAEVVRRFVMRDAWRHWRRLMDVVMVGRALKAQRQRSRLHRALLAWTDMAARRRQHRAASAARMRAIVQRYVKQQRDRAVRRAAHDFTAQTAVRRRRLARAFQGWKRFGVEDLQQRNRTRRMLREQTTRDVWDAWTAALHERRRALGEAESRVAAAAKGRVMREAVEQWRHTLYLRALFETWGGGIRELPAFIQWRHHSMERALRAWRTVKSDAAMDRTADDWRTAKALRGALVGWGDVARRNSTARTLEETTKTGVVRTAFTVWYEAAVEEAEEREKASALRDRLDSLGSGAPPSVAVSSVLLAALRPHLPSQPPSHFFRVWATYASDARRLAHLHTLAGQHRSRRLVTAILSGWRRVSQHSAARRQWADGIERSLDAVTLRAAWHRWALRFHAARSTNDLFLLRRAFWTLKLQSRRMRERRQLLAEADRSPL